MFTVDDNKIFRSNLATGQTERRHKREKIPGQVVEVGVQVRVHQDRGEEEDGEGQVEVEREVEENQRRQYMCNMRMT